MHKVGRWRGAVMLAGASTIGAVLSVAGTAYANGRLPAGHQLVVSPSDPNFFAMETAFGLLFSHDKGASWSWVCEKAAGYGDGGVQDPPLGLTPSAVLAGLTEGLSLSPDQGCSWSFVLSDPVVDLVVRPGEPHQALALTSRFSSVGDGGENLYETHALATIDDGAHWSPQGVAVDSTVQVETIDTAPSDPMRIYVSGARRQRLSDGGSVNVGVVLASTNGGASYGETTIELDPIYEENTGSIFVSAVDPTDPNRVYARVHDLVRDRLLVSDDGGATFRTVLQAHGTLVAFALSSDGSKVFVGGPLDGVWMASAYGDSGTALQFVQKSTTTVYCMTWAAGVLYACTSDPNTSSRQQQLGTSSDDGVTFVPRFDFACLSGPLSCTGCSVFDECAPDLLLVRASIGECDGGAEAPMDEAGCAFTDAATPGADGGPRDASDTSVPPPPPKPAKTGCGCGLGASVGAGELSVIALLVTLALRRRR